MKTSEEQLELINGMEDNELLIARLYAAYAEHFEECGAFWLELAEDEKKHADMIRTLLHQVREGTLRLSEHRFDLTSIQMLHDYVKVLLSKARSELLPLKDAFGQALAIEHDLIERQFFQVFETDSAELKIVLEALEVSTKEHRKRLLAAIEELEKPKE